MTPGARWFFGRKGRVPHAVTIGGAVLWPKGQGPPHLTPKAKPGFVSSVPALLSSALRRVWISCASRPSKYGSSDQWLLCPYSPILATTRCTSRRGYAPAHHKERRRVVS